MLYRVEGIVIRSIDYGEGNKIVTLLTREIGKTAVLARGAKKLKSRHSAVAQLFTYGEFAFYASARGQMGTLQQGEIINAHHRLRHDLHMAAYASYLAEMADRMLPDGEVSEVLFEQLLAAFAAIEQEKDAQVIAHLFEMKMLGWAGYMPELDVCAFCRRKAGSDPADDSVPQTTVPVTGERETGRKTVKPIALSVSMGGVLCANCQKRDPAAIAVSPRAIALLDLFRKLDLRRIGEVKVKDETKAELKRCLRAFIDHHVGVQWKSRHFLDQMDKYRL